MSSQEPLKSGQLVRYLETASRWYLARVRRVRGDKIELSLFDGSPPIVAASSQVEPFETFLGQRERAFSRTRSQLTTFFYGREFERLRDTRLREMQKTLRRAGISFRPDEWPTAETQIQLWRDKSFVDQQGLNPALEAILPQWLEPFALPSGSRDPLGLQAPAEKLVNEVLPGLTVFTSRAGYYGFLAWAIRTVNGLSLDAIPRFVSRREILNALERTLALSEFVYHGIGDESCRLIGQRSKLRVLSASEGDRYRVPVSILKNQNSAGCFRLFATSLVSLGLVEEADDLAPDGLLPFRLTNLGDELAGVFHAHVDKSFLKFAMGEQRQSRELIRDWGKSLCFSSIARRSSYRKRLLRGLLMGNSRDTEKRYQTVTHLFTHGLLNGNNVGEVGPDSLNEEDAALLEGEIEGAGISNKEVIFHFYGCKPANELRALQSLAVFELLSLGLSAIFHAAVASVTQSGMADIGGLSRAIASVDALAELWQAPMKDAKPKTVKKLADDLLDCEDAIQAAAIGGALLVRVVRDPQLTAVWDVLIQMAREPVEMIDQCLRKRMGNSLKEVLPDLLLAMVERHELVSKRKNRQRWLFVEGAVLVRDDPQNMELGFHALRFPQLGSLAWDVDLNEEDLRNG